MKNRVSALSGYIASAVLLLFYLFVLSGSAETDVSLEYSMFYIEDKLAYFVEDGGLKKYGTGEEFLYTTDGMYRNQGKGWGSITENGTWTNGAGSYLYFYVNTITKDKYGYGLKIRTAESIGKSMAVHVNGKKAGEGIVGEDGMCCIAMPANCFRQGINEILLETDADKNQAYLLVEAVTLEKLGERYAKKDETE